MTPPRDIVVVGAGIVGCAIAYELARRGASVEIVDDRPAGMGATHAAAGMLAPFSEVRDGGPLLDLTARSLDLYDGFVARIAADSGVRVPYERTGTLEIAFTADALDSLRRASTALAARGVGAEFLEREAVHSHERQLSGNVLGGLLIPTHGFVAAAELARALATAARRHGAQLIEHGRVRSITQEQGELLIRTDRGSLAADAVVVAAGSWSGQVNVGGVAATVPVKPIRGQLLQLSWPGRRIERVLWSDRCYIVPWSDGTVLVGATVEDVGFDERTTVEGVKHLLDAACDVIPGVRVAGFLSAKAGLRPGTPDHLPIIGMSGTMPTVMYATGHYRNGILLAPLTAQLVADALLDGRIDPMLGPLSPGRFGPP